MPAGGRGGRVMYFRGKGGAVFQADRGEEQGREPHTQHQKHQHQHIIITRSISHSPHALPQADMTAT